MASTGKIEAFVAEPRNVVVAGIRRGGRPHLSPNWFYWDCQCFFVSTTRGRVKYAIFRRDPRAQLLVDDPAGFRAMLVRRRDPRGYRRRAAPLSCHPGKARVAVPPDQELLRALTAEGRVLLAITPDRPPSG